VRQKLALVVAIVLVPGGLIALLCTVLLRMLARTRRGKKLAAAARRRVKQWTAGLRIPPVFGARQVA
jgi:hypothetical protein